MLLHKFIEMLTFRALLKVRKSQLIALKKKTIIKSLSFVKRHCICLICHIYFEWWVEFIHNFLVILYRLTFLTNGFCLHVVLVQTFTAQQNYLKLSGFKEE